MSSKAANLKAGSSLTVSGHATPSTTEVTEQLDTPRDYLFKSGVNSILTNCLNLLVQNRPKDPIAFLVDYFGNLVEQKSVIQETFQRITWTNYSKPAFYRNLFESYQLFKIKKGKHFVKGLKGAMFNDLVFLLTADLSPAVQQDILSIALCQEKQSVTFPIFHRKILTIFVYKDYIKLCESLYSDIDLAGRGKADTFLCNFILENIRKLCGVDSTMDAMTAASVACDFNDPQFVDELLRIMREDEFARTKRIMKSEEFLGNCITYFLQMVK